MVSKKVLPTPPPGGPALVRPALGALLFGLAGMACGDDGGDGDTANDSQPPMTTDVAPMIPPTTTEEPTTSVPPMIPPTSTSDDGADTASSTDGGTEVPPMIPPTTGDTSDTGTGSGSDSGSTGPIPPMPPPDGGAAPDDDREI